MLPDLPLFVFLRALPFVLLAFGWAWMLGRSSIVSRWRRCVFIGGMTAASPACGGQFLLHWYLWRAKLGFWPEVDIILGFGQVMLIAAAVAFAAAWFGAGYGRAAACCGSFLVMVIWILIGTAAV